MKFAAAAGIGDDAVANTAPEAAPSVTLVRPAPVRSRAPAPSGSVRRAAAGSLTSAKPRAKSRRRTPFQK